MTDRNPYESLITWFANNAVAANLLMACLLVAGLWSVVTIKKETFPRIETNYVTVTMPFLGATPEDVEEGVLIKIEEAIQDVEGIKEIVSTARRGSGTVRVEVMQEYDVDRVMDQVKNRVDAIASFPENTERPVVSRTEYQGQVVIVSIYGDVDERTLKEYAKQVRNEIVSLPGVTRAEVLGARPYEISIEVSEYTLQQYGLTLAEVSQAIRRGSLDLSAGVIRADSGDIQVRTKGQAYVGRDFEDIVIRTNPDGTRVMLSDLAEIRDGFVEGGRYSEFNGKPAISVSVQSVGSQSDLDISATVRDYVAKKQATSPPGVSLASWADTSYYLKGRLDLMLKNLFFGALLVFLSLTLFLRLKLAFWVMLGLPVAFLGTFMLLPSLDLTVNMISLFGFILVLGIVVDDAIVIGESAYTNMRAKGHSVNNIVEGVLRVATPATFGVLTTIAAFLPMVLISGTAGRFLQPAGWVVILCLTFSIVESKLILPAHLAHMKVRRYDPDTTNRFVRFQRFFSEGMHRFIDRVYTPMLERALRRRYLTLSVFISLLILSVGLVVGGILRTVFFPDFSSDFLRVSIEMNEGTRSERTHDVLRRVQEGLWAVDREYSAEQGMEAGGLVDNAYAVAAGDTQGNVTAELVKDSATDISNSEVIRRWREKVGDIPGVKQLSFQGLTGIGGGPSVSFQLIGSNIDQLARAAAELEKRVRQYEGVYDVRNSFERGRPELKLDIKPEAESLGLSLADLARQMRAGFYGEEVQRVQRGQDEVRVMVRFPEDERNSLGYLNQMRIRTPDGGQIPFHAVAKVEMTESPTFIQRFDRERAVLVTAEIDKEKYEPGKIRADIAMNELPEVLSLFPGVRSRQGGAGQAQQEATAGLIKGAALSLFLIYALMAIPLRSYSQPLIIMSVIPFGTIGALFGHWVIGIPVSITSLFGIIALAGVVVNDSLILVDFVNRERRLGVPVAQAARDAARQRFRAIILTSLTTFLGLLPITLEKSIEAQTVVPMAASLAFGIVFATVITLFLIPSLYLILDDFRKWWRNALGHALPWREPPERHPHPAVEARERGSKA